MDRDEGQRATITVKGQVVEFKLLSDQESVDALTRSTPKQRLVLQHIGRGLILTHVSSQWQQEAAGVIAKELWGGS